MEHVRTKLEGVALCQRIHQSINCNLNIDQGLCDIKVHQGRRSSQAAGRSSWLRSQAGGFSCTRSSTWEPRAVRTTNTCRPCPASPNLLSPLPSFQVSTKTKLLNLKSDVHVEAILVRIINSPSGRSSELCRSSFRSGPTCLQRGAREPEVERRRCASGRR